MNKQNNFKNKNFTEDLLGWINLSISCATDEHSECAQLQNSEDVYLLLLYKNENGV